MRYQLNKHQAGILTAAMLASLKLLSLPSLFYDYSKASALIIFSILLIFDVFCIWLVFTLKERNNNFNFFKFLEKHLGKILSKIVILLLLFYFVAKISYLLLESFYYIKGFADEDVSMIEVLIVFLPIVATMAHNGLKSIGRTAELFFWAAVIGIVSSLFIAFLPQFLNSMVPTSFSAPFFKLSFFCGDFLPLLLVIDRVKPETGLKGFCMFHAVLTSSALFLMYLIYYMFYNITAPLHQNAIGDIILFTKGLDYTTSINMIAYVTYLLIMFVQGAMLYYVAGISVEHIVSNKNRII